MVTASRLGGYLRVYRQQVLTWGGDFDWVELKGETMMPEIDSGLLWLTDGSLHHQLVRVLAVRGKSAPSLPAPADRICGVAGPLGARLLISEPALREIEPYHPHLGFLPSEVDAYSPVELEAIQLGGLQPGGSWPTVLRIIRCLGRSRIRYTLALKGRLENPVSRRPNL